MKEQTKIFPLPEMLGRKDITKEQQGDWLIDTCKPARGNPFTDIIGRQMRVPVADEQVDRVIRAHEMMHARVSPAHDYPKWIERHIASDSAMKVVEEVRVNFLVRKAGFDTDVLSDGTELPTGMRFAERKDWANCVLTAVGYAHCGGGKDFITGVRRVNKAWATTLRGIVKRVEKEMDKAYKTGTLGSTERDPASGLAPLGFAHTERIAEWVERLAEVEPQDEVVGDKQGESQNDDNKDGKKENEKDGDPSNKATNQKAKDIHKDIKPIEPKRGASPTSVPQWGKLKVKHLPMTRRAKGGLGRKRIASPIGRNPRRIGNALVDPEKRVFDKTKRGNGGIVLIDGSGSMQLNSKQIMDITEQAPGCTVAMYSADKDNIKDNLLVLAENGKMVDKLPERNGGNGVDGEAIRWAIKQRRSASTPIVWVTDGAVHGLGSHGAWGGYHDLLAMDCIKESLKGKVFVARNMKDGIEVLKQLKLGKTPKRWYPNSWKETYLKTMGRRLG